MFDQNAEIIVNVSVISVGALVLFFIVRSGMLRNAVLQRAQVRRTGLGLIDLLVALFIMILGGLAGGVLLNWLNASVVSATLPAALPGEGAGARAMATQALLGQACTQVPVAIYLYWRLVSRRHGLRELGLQPRFPLTLFLRALVTLFAALPMVMGTILLVTLIGQTLHFPAPEMGHEMLTALVNSSDVPAKIAIVFSAAIVAPFFEELLFRGLLQTVLLESLSVRHRRMVIILAAALFTLAHLGSVPWQAMSGLFMLGLVLGWTYEATGQLWICILVHAGFNAVNLALALLGADKF